MHELSIAMSIVELAEEYAGKEGAGKVTELEIEVGDFSGVVIEALDFAMEEAIRGTRCEGALWKIIRIHPLARCRSCGHEYQPGSLYQSCPACGEYGADIVQGKELRLKSILVE